MSNFPFFPLLYEQTKILKKKVKVGEFKSFDWKTYCKAIVIVLGFSKERKPIGRVREINIDINE